MDSTALSLCMDNGLPIHVFNMDDERNIDRIVCGERVGTVVTSMIDDLLKDFLDEATARMEKSVEATRGEFATVRTGRASPHLLDRIDVDYYGANTPLSQLAQISATEARLLTITPYDKTSIKAIEKAILESDVGLTPSNDGNVIRLQIPELTEERRKELVKVVHDIAEQGRVAVRNIRRDVMHDLRELKSGGRGGLGRRAPRRVRAAEADRRPHRRDRHRPRRQGRRDPRGLTRHEASASRRGYVAIIMDGNGRWAQGRGLPVLAGPPGGRGRGQGPAARRGGARRRRS